MMVYWINVTKNCNLKCTYCYQKDYHKSYNMSREAADRIINFIIFENREDARVQFFGGEPALNFKMVKYITEKLVKHGIDRFSLTSNMTLWTEEMLDFLDYHHFHVLASIDGTKESHDLQRKRKDGSGSFDLAFENLQKVIERPNIELKIAKVVANHNKEYFYSDFMFFKNLGVPVAFNVDSSNLINNEKEKDLFIHQMKQIMGEFLQLEDKSLFPKLYEWTTEYLNTKNGVRSTGKRKTCYTSESLDLAFDYKAEAYPCHYMAEMEMVPGVLVQNDPAFRQQLLTTSSDYNFLEEKEIIASIQREIEIVNCNDCKYAGGCLEYCLEGRRNACVLKRYQFRNQSSALPTSPFCLRQLVFQSLDHYSHLLSNNFEEFKS